MQIEDIDSLDGFDVESLKIATTPAEFLEAMVLTKSHRADDDAMYLVARLKPIKKAYKDGKGDIKDRDGDGKVFDGTRWERAATAKPAEGEPDTNKEAQAQEKAAKESGGGQPSMAGSAKAGGAKPTDAKASPGAASADGDPAGQAGKKSPDLSGRIMAQGGFTYQPTTGNSPKRGFSLAVFPGKEKILTIADVTERSLAQYMVDNAEQFKDGEVHFGAWFNQKTDDNPNGDDKVYLDMSIVVEDRETAVTRARELGQLGIYDLEKGETIETMTPDERKQWEGSQGKPDPMQPSEDLTKMYGGWTPQWQDKPNAAKFIAARDSVIDPGLKAMLSHISPADLAKDKLFFSADGKVGAAVSPEGDIKNVFNNSGPRGAATEAMIDAVKHGGMTLDCFDTILPTYYASFGFEEVARMKFNRDFAPEGWDYDRFKEPDVVFMARTKGFSEEEMRNNARDKSRWEKPTRTDNYTDDWDGAKTESTRRAGEARDGKGKEAEPTSRTDDSRSSEGATDATERDRADAGGAGPSNGAISPDRGNVAPPKPSSKEEAQSTIKSSRAWQAWSKHAVDIGSMDKATRKAALAAMPNPPALINEPSLYFNTEKSHLTVDPEILDHEKAFEPASMANATKLMGLAAIGKTGKRDPVDVAMRDGRLVVVNGNSTTNASRENGLHVPVRLVDSDPSHWFSSDETKRDNSPKAHSKQKSYEEHLAAAEENMSDRDGSFKDVLDLGQGLSDSIGAKLPSFDEALRLAASGEKKPMIIFGPIKSAESAGRKVRDKYDGDFSRLTDVVRATVVVGSYSEVGPALAALKKEAEQRGWEVVAQSGENKFQKPTDAGYRDVSLSLRAPNGQVAEMQVNTTAMWHAKETDGHRLYESWRVLDAKRKRGEANESDLAEKAKLEVAQQELYGNAWKRSQASA